MSNRDLALAIGSIRRIRKALCITVCSSGRGFVGGPLFNFQITIGSHAVAVPYGKVPTKACTVSLFRSRGKGKGLSANSFKHPLRGFKFDGSTRNVVKTPSCRGYYFRFGQSAAIIVRLG